MKNIITTIILCLIILSTYAQKVVEQTISTNGKKEMTFHARFAKNIKLATWDKNDIYIKASADINNGKDNDYFNLKISEKASFIDVEEDYGQLFKDLEKQKKEPSPGGKRSGYNIEINVDYVIYVPQNMALDLRSISGSSVVENYQGDLVMDFISGDIEIKKYQGDLNLKTISGDIDIYIDKAYFVAETFSGTIYSDERIAFEADKKRSFGQKIRGTIKNDRQTVKLNTHNGNIYLRQ